MTTVHTYTHMHTHTSLTQCSSENRASVHVQEPPLKPQQITHTVKLINKARKKEYKIEKLGSIPFSSLESIKAALKDRGGDVSDGIGYIEPGHGLNGKQKWLLDDDDVSEMYAAHKNSRELMLYNVSGGGGESSTSVTRGKRPKEKPPKEAPPPKRGSTITQVEAIMAELKHMDRSLILQSMPAGPTVSRMGSIVPWMRHQISPSLLVERKVAVSVIAQALLLHLDHGPLPNVLIYALSASTS